MNKINCPHRRATFTLEKLGDVTISELSIGVVETLPKDMNLSDKEIIEIIENFSSLNDNDIKKLVLSEVAFLWDMILELTFGIKTDKKSEVDNEKK